MHEVERVAAGERGVLEVAEHGEHAEDAEPEHEPAPVREALPLEQAASHVADRRRAGHERGKPPRGVRIEVVRRRHDQEQPQPVPRDEEVRRADEREEAEEERKAVEEHAGGVTLGRGGG